MIFAIIGYLANELNMRVKVQDFGIFEPYFYYFRDTLIVAFGNIATSLFAGFVIFAIIGYLANELNMRVKLQDFDIFELSPMYMCILHILLYYFRDTLIVAFGNIATSLFAGFVIFAIIGYLANELNMRVKVQDFGIFEL